jgi:hypothetical protein
MLLRRAIGGSAAGRLTRTLARCCLAIAQALIVWVVATGRAERPEAPDVAQQLLLRPCGFTQDGER